MVVIVILVIVVVVLYTVKTSKLFQNEDKL